MIKKIKKKIESLMTKACINAIKYNMDYYAINLLDKLDRTNDKLDVIINYYKQTYSETILQKKIFLLTVPDHSNIGDSAITIGMYEFAKSYFSEYSLIEVPIYHDFEERYNLLRRTITNADLLFFQGGGNMGNVYINEENIRRRVISEFPANVSVIFPQTIHFENTSLGRREAEHSKKIYNSCSKLMIFTRDNKSLGFVKEYIPHAAAGNAPDMAFFLQPQMCMDRNGILICLRGFNDEKGFAYDTEKRIIDILNGKSNDIVFSDNHYHPLIPQIDRNIIVKDELKKFSSVKLVVTDRLHGVIFSLISHTPCIAFNGATNKIKNFMESCIDSEGLIFMDEDNMDLFNVRVDEMLQKGDSNYIFKHNVKKFDDVANIIRSKINEGDK